MNLSSLATNALATTRSTFKGLADAAAANGGNADAPQAKAPAAEKPAAAPVTADGRADAAAAAPKGVRLGTVLDAYA